MNIASHILNATGKLTPFVEGIEKNFNSIVKKVSTFMPISNIDVVFYENADRTMPERGFSGYAPNASTVFITLNPEFTQLKQSLQDYLGETLAHEFHHNMRWRDPGYGPTLLDALAAEGLACYFAIEVYHKSPPPWVTALNEKQITEYLQRAKEDLYNRKFDYEGWFLGKGTKVTNIPRWTGYSLAFYVVGKYLKDNPGKKPSQLYNIKSEEFMNLL